MKRIKKYLLTILGIFGYNSFVFAEFQPIGSNKNNLPDLEAASFLNNVLHIANVSLALVFIFSSLLLLTSGIYFITAGGDEAGLDNAHNMWRLAVLGFVIALLGYLIVNLIKFFI